MTESFALGDSAVMKKPHACGTNDWVIIRVGADIKIRCKACGRIVMLPREDFTHSCKKIIPCINGETSGGGNGND